MATLTVSFTIPTSGGITGYRIQYRVRGTSDPYVTVTPTPTTSPVTITGLLGSTEYEGTVSSICGASFSIMKSFITCTCPTGYTASLYNADCTQVVTQAPNVTQTAYCLVSSMALPYAHARSRIYNPGFSNSSIGLLNPPAGEIYADMSTPLIWRGGTSTTGPMNDASVWVDANCDGIRDALVAGQDVTVATLYKNTGAPRTIYIGAGGDNEFMLKVNDVVIADTAPNPLSSINFNIWHIFPVALISGDNYINIIGNGDGSTSDSLGMVVYDNTREQLVAATSQSDLNVLYTSASARGTTIDVAYCDPGYTLDTSGGSGNYSCVKTTHTSCIGA